MQEDGFEYKLPGDEEATFFRWARGYGAKDLMLIDRVTGGMPIAEFDETIREGSLARGPVMLAVMATSIRAKFPDWTVERIMKAVMGIDIVQDVEFVGGEEDEEPTAVPPASGGEENENSDSSSAESKSSATPAATSA